VASRYSALHSDILIQSDAQEQLLQDWVLWQRGRGMSDKTITDRLTVIRRIRDAASLTPQGVDRFLISAALAKSTRANYHGDPRLVQVADHHRPPIRRPHHHCHHPQLLIS